MITGTVSSSKLSGALPAINGANLTGCGDGVLRAAADPTISTNPAGGVGTTWINTSSGNMWCCTDATAGSNVWTNIGKGSGDVEPAFKFQGDTYGWRIGGGPGGTKIDRYPFATQTNSTNVGDLLYSGNLSAQGGAKSKTHGYMVGADGSPTTKNTINKFAFSSGGSVTATDVGDLDTGVYGAGVAGNGDHIWCAAGYSTSITNPIQKLATASDGNATQTGTIGSNQYMTSGQSSETNGYIAGGLAGQYSPNTNKIHKWSFASDGNATQPMTLNTSRRNTSSNSSTTHGYSHGGYPGNNQIEKFTFAADNNATDVGDLVVGGDYGNGSSSNTHGYCAGNRYAPYNTIERYSFSSDGNSVDWADLSYTNNSGGPTAAS